MFEVHTQKEDGSWFKLASFTLWIHAWLFIEQNRGVLVINNS